MEKKSYLEQLREYCEKYGRKFKIDYCSKNGFTAWYWRESHNDWQGKGGEATIEEAARRALWCMQMGKEESSTPHEDALKSWCKDMGYTFSNVNSCISIPELSLWCIHCYYTDDKEYACKHVLDKAKGLHKQAYNELKDAFKDNEEVYWTIPISHTEYNSIGIRGDLGGQARSITPCKSYPEACRNLIKAGKELLREVKPKTPHEDALRAYCNEKGLLLAFADFYFSPTGALGELQVFYPMHLPLYACQWAKNFDSVIGTKEDACEQALKGLKHNDEVMIRRELEKFCREEGLTLSTTLDFRIEISPGDGRASLYFKNYTDALSSLIHAKTYGDWIWKNKDKAELEKFCTENGLIATYSGLGVSIRTPATASCDVNSITLNWPTAAQALSGIKEMQSNKQWIWRMGPYECKVRQLCESKGWACLDEKVRIRVLELASLNVYSFKQGEPGFKEVWDNIQKLKELLS